MDQLNAFFVWVSSFNLGWSAWLFAFAGVIAFLFTALLKAKKLKVSTWLFKFDYEAKK
jgi:Na+/phosphate symporter